MIKKFNQYLNEEYLDGQFKDQSGSNYKVYQLLYYAFDWDDNILKMPTEIILLNNVGDEIGMSTQDFAEYREKIGKEEFEYQGQNIVGYSKDAFRYFRDQIDSEVFVKDTQKALSTGMYAKAWDDFIECLTTGSLFAIITARGHEPETIRKGVELIIKGFNSEQRASMIDHLKMFAYLFDETISSDDDLISKYLDHCEYIGVSAPSRGAGAENPEHAKVEAFKEFVRKCDDFARELEDNFNQSTENWKVIAKIGFSDDDRKNFKTIDEVVKELDNETYSNVKEFYIKYTGEGGDEKNIYTKYSESKIKNFTNFLNETSHQTPGLESSVLTSTQFGNQAGRLNPQGPLNRQDDFYNQFRRQVNYLSKNSKEILKKSKKSSK
jgi:hypothetical protein